MDEQPAPSPSAAALARSEIIFHRCEPRWQNGQAIGNGDLGGAVFSGEGGGETWLGVTLNKVDVWDERYDRQGHRYYSLAELRALIAEHAHTDEGRQFLRRLEPYCIVGQGAHNEWYQQSYPYAYAPPTPKPVGRVRVGLGGVGASVEQRLSLARGEVTFTAGGAAAGVTVTAHIDAHRNVLVLRVERRGPATRPLTLEFWRYADEQLGVPDFTVGPSSFSHQYAFPEGLTYAVAGLVEAAGQVSAEKVTGVWQDIEARTGWVVGQPGYMRNWDEPVSLPDHGVRLTLAPETAAAVLYLAVVTTHEQPDPPAAAGALARRASTQAAAQRAAHLAWWRDFWGRSSLRLSDPLVEALWYQGLYLLALQARGGLPPSLVGPGYYLPHAGWNGHFITDFNVEMNCWPIYTANHLELGRPVFDFFRRNLDTLRQDTQRLYGLEGVKIPGICIRDAREISYLPCRLWQSSSAWICQLYWWAYQYSGDRAFLAETAYPLLRAVAQFYRGYAVLGADGRYHIAPSTAPEQPPWWATDPAIDLALLRVHLRATLDAADLLGRDADLRPGWQDLLDRLAAIPTDGTVWLDEREAAPDKRLGHAGLLMAVFSAGLVGARSPAAEQALAVRSLDNTIAHTSRRVVNYPLDVPTWNDDCNWPYIILVTARLGLGERARAYLYDYGLLQHLKPNGQFAFDCPLDDQQRATRWGMPDSSHAFTAAVSEMLLQSYAGVIHVAPAVPADWDAAFSGFLAVGAFEVEAQIAQGRVRALAITSRQGGVCRVVHPWPGRPVTIRCCGEQVGARLVDDELHFATRPGERYELAAEGTAPPDPPIEAPPSPAQPRVYTGPAYLWSVAPDQRLLVRLGLPA
ncbi:MAG: hypothetical protein IT317_03745 [Anaerolineales bacterium]|nr:hypothetical protein [Anaerolineales bacterium]